MNMLEQLRSELDRLEHAGLRRRPVELSSAAGPRVIVDGREVVCLCSNDYLGLAADPAVVQAATDAVGTWGVGSGASRLVSGTMVPHRRLERAIAAFKGAEDAVVTSTGWMANRAAICSLAGRGDLVLCDKLDHASILDAARAFGARMKTYPHRDTEALEKILARRRPDYDRCFIVTDSIFSMDGDLAPLEKLVAIKRRYDAALVIDEAHGTGVFGPRGRGVAEHCGVEEDVDCTVGTLSKAVGCLGGFIAAPRVLCEYLRNTARSYIYTTAPPPAVCAAAETALALIDRRPEDRRGLLRAARDLRERLAAAGFDTLDAAGQIIPVVIGDAERATAVSRRLLEEGFLLPAIRPPTVPRGTSRLRISLCAGHRPEEIERLVAALRRVSEAR